LHPNPSSDVIKTAVGEGDGGGMELGSEESPAPTAGNTSQLEDIGEVRVKLVLECERQGNESEVGESHALGY
jgi:hypothetical protein